MQKSQLSGLVSLWMYISGKIELKSISYQQKTQLFQQIPASGPIHVAAELGAMIGRRAQCKSPSS